MLPLFFLSMQLLTWVMGWFGGDPGVAVIVDGKETFPLVPVAVGLYSTVFNIFNTALMFPFIGVFDRVLSRIGAHANEDVEDYSQPRYLDVRTEQANMATGVPAGSARDGSLPRRRRQVPGDRARRAEDAPDDVGGALCRPRCAKPGNPRLHGGACSSPTCLMHRQICWQA